MVPCKSAFTAIAHTFRLVTVFEKIGQLTEGNIFRYYPLCVRVISRENYADIVYGNISTTRSGPRVLIYGEP